MKKHITIALLFIVFGSIFLSSLAKVVCAEDAGIQYLNEALLSEAKSSVQEKSQELTLPSIGEIAFKMGFFLLVVLVFIFGIALFLQKILKVQGGAGLVQQEVIKVVSQRKFDARRSMYIVDVLGKVLIIGSDIDGLSLITEITDPGQIEEARKLTAVKQDIFTFNPFQGVLDTFSGQYKESHKQRKRDKQTHGLLKNINQLKNRLDV